MKQLHCKSACYGLTQWTVVLLLRWLYAAVALYFHSTYSQCVLLIIYRFPFRHRLIWPFTAFPLYLDHMRHVQAKTQPHFDILGLGQPLCHVIGVSLLPLLYYASAEACASQSLSKAVLPLLSSFCSLCCRYLSQLAMSKLCLYEAVPGGTPSAASVEAALSSPLALWTYRYMV